MKRRFLIIGIVILIILIIGALIFVVSDFYKNKSSGTETENYQTGSTSTYTPPQFQYGVADEEDYNNFEEIIKQNQMIQELPDGGILLLSFFNFNSGERVREKTYILTQGNAEEGDVGEYDIKMVMHSKYLTVLTENNLCVLIKTAKSNGDFGTETAISKTKLLWKYKGMFEYKDCLGL